MNERLFQQVRAKSPTTLTSANCRCVVGTSKSLLRFAASRAEKVAYTGHNSQCHKTRAIAPKYQLLISFKSGFAHSPVDLDAHLQAIIAVTQLKTGKSATFASHAHQFLSLPAESSPPKPLKNLGNFPSSPQPVVTRHQTTCRIKFFHGGNGFPPAISQLGHLSSCGNSFFR